MLLAKKLLMGDVNPMMFVFPKISSGGRQIAFSDYYITRDGTTLDHHTFPASANWISPVYGHKKYITLATGSSGAEVYSSPEGITWTYLGSLTGASSARLLFDGEYFYVFTSSGGTIYKSRDGSSWSNAGTVPTMYGTFTGHSAGVAYRNGTFIIGSWDSTNHKAAISYSTNGCASWSSTTIPNYGPTTTRTQFRGVAACSNGFVMSFSDTTSNAINLFYSSNGISWAKSSLSITSGMTEIISDGKNAYVSLVGSTPSTLGYKTNGDGTWTQITLNGQPSNNPSASINKRFFCVGSCATSSNVFTVYRYNLDDGSVGSYSKTLVSPTSSYVYYYGFSETAS